MPAWDAVVVGGGHNGLTAAAYLARAGLRVLVLERLSDTGGAAVSDRVFRGVDARLSRYAYLVSLLPRRIVTDLGLRLRLARRRYSSYTPDPGRPARGLLVDRYASASEAWDAFAAVDAAPDAVAWSEFYSATTALARVVFPSLLEPLPTAAELSARLADAELWEALTTCPLGSMVEDWFSSDLVRGVVATDGLIGTFASLRGDDLAANRCFLYHVIGGGSGDWDVPVGGMGTVTDELARAARQAGAVLRTGAEVTAIDPDAAEVVWHDGTTEYVEQAGMVLSGVAPAVLGRLLGQATDTPEGAQVKVNLLVRRLPALADPRVAPAAAFSGTLHVNETFSQLEAGHAAAAAGGLPVPLPCEVYCHTLTDPGILSPGLAASGYHTLTVFGLHTPHRLATGADLRDRLQAAVLSSLNSVLAEPVEDVLAVDSDGAPCIETRTTADLAETLGMPGGHIFHGPLAWPWREAGDQPGSPAERWGVATAHPRVLLCGSGAVRGGAVSGIGGHNAAMAVLETLQGR